MTQFPQDDQQLITFLRQHRASAPVAPPELEEQIMAAVEVLDEPSQAMAALKPPANVKPLSRQRRLWQQQPWLVPSALAASFLAAFAAYQTLVPAQPSAAELASLEVFLENNWHGTVSSEADGEYFPISYPLNN